MLFTGPWEKERARLSSQRTVYVYIMPMYKKIFFRLQQGSVQACILPWGAGIVQGGLTFIYMLFKKSQSCLLRGLAYNVTLKLNLWWPGLNYRQWRRFAQKINFDQTKCLSQFQFHNYLTSYKFPCCSTIRKFRNLSSVISEPAYLVCTLGISSRKNFCSELW